MLFYRKNIRRRCVVISTITRQGCFSFYLGSQYVWCLFIRLMVLVHSDFSFNLVLQHGWNFLISQNSLFQNRDGGWGLHIEGPSTMFGSVLNYVTLRLLGEGANDGRGAMERGRSWILEHGGATALTSWGKMWLSVLYWTYFFLVLNCWFGFFIFYCSLFDSCCILDANRYLEHLNGLATIPFPLRYGFFLIFYHSIQVSAHLCIFLWNFNWDKYMQISWYYLSEEK